MQYTDLNNIYTELSKDFASIYGYFWWRWKAQALIWTLLFDIWTLFQKTSFKKSLNNYLVWKAKNHI